MLKFQITSQNLKLVEKPSRDIVDNQINFLSANFVFSEEWTDIKKLVQFTQERGKDDWLVNIDLGTSNDVTIKMPSDIRAGILNIACYGEIIEKDEDGAKDFIKKVGTTKYSIPIVESGINDEGLEIGIVGDKNYVHEQLQASNEWSVNHKLKKYPSVSIIDSAGTNIIGEVTYLDENSLRINLSSIMSGKAFLN